MSDYAVITHNDESEDDVKGDLYHYPPTYRSILTPGCRIVYYKGGLIAAPIVKSIAGPLRCVPEAMDDLITANNAIRCTRSER